MKRVLNFIILSITGKIYSVPNSCVKLNYSQINTSLQREDQSCCLCFLFHLTNLYEKLSVTPTLMKTTICFYIRITCTAWFDHIYIYV